MSDELKQEQIFWRLILNDVCKLEELDSSYTLDDVMKANTMLDVKNEVDAIMAEQDPNNAK